MTRLAGLALAVAVFVFWAVRIVPGDAILLPNGDLFGYFYPAYAGTYARLRAGELPLWNPYQLCGIPWLATLQAGAFYPPHVVYLFLPTHTAMAVSSAAHLVFIALATAAFARRVGLRLESAVLAALLFACRGQIPSLLYCPPAIEAAAWLPVGALGIVDLVRGPARRGGVLVAVAAGASLLAGYPQNTLFLLYAWGTLFVALLTGDRAAGRTWVVRGLVFGGALALGGLLAAVQLLPTMELTADSVRGTRTLPLTHIYPLGGGILGNAAWAFLTTSALWKHPLALGMVGLVFAPLAFARGPQRTLAWWAAGLGVAALLFALGPITPAFGVLLSLPGLAWFRIPTRILFVTDFCYALLCAIGLDAVLGPATSRARAVGASAVAVALVVLTFAGRVEPNAGPLVLGAAAVALVALALRPTSRLGRGAAATVVLAAVAADLLAAPPRGLRFPFGSQTPSLIFAQRATYEELRTLAGHDRVWIFTSLPPVDLGPKLATLYAVRSFDDYEPLVTRRHGEYMTYLWEGAVEPTRPPYVFAGYLNSLDPPRGQPAPASRRRLIDLAAVRFVLFPPHLVGRADVARFIAASGLVSFGAVGRLVAFENPTRMPRAYVTYRTEAAPDAATLLAAVSRPEFDPLAASYVEGAPSLAAAPDAPARGAPATIVRDEERTVEIDAVLDAPGLVVLADTFYPGWRATVDDAPAPVVAVDLLFRGVPAPAGRHRIRFTYEPASVRRGIAASGVGLALLAVVAVSGRRRSARRPPR